MLIVSRDAISLLLIALATSPEFRDQSPKQIVPRLADQGRYLASEATFYRVLHAEDMQHHRGRARPSIVQGTCSTPFPH